MNLNDDNIDKLFRDAASNEQSPAFKEAYWNEMEVLIKQENVLRNSKVFDGFWMIFSVLSFVGMFVFALTHSFSETVELVSNEESVRSEKEIDLLRQQEQSQDFGNEQRMQIVKVLHASVMKDNEIPEHMLSQKANEFSVKEQLEPISTEMTSRIHTNQFSEIKGLNGEGYLKDLSELGFSKAGVLPNEDMEYFTKEETNSLENTAANNQHSSFSKEWDRLSPKLVLLSGFKMEQEGLISPPIRRVRPDHGLSLDFGLSFAEPYKAGATSSNRFSVAAIYSLDYNNIILRTGIGVNLERAANLSVREESLVYGYDVTKYENVLSYTSFTELYLPLEIGYRFNNTTFGAGGQVNQLLGTRMAHTEMINGQIISDRMLNNRTEGLNTFTGGVYLWVQQHLSARLLAGMRVGKNTVSRIDAAEYVHDVSRPSPIFGQIYVSYRLW
jgi:hypothetical protein